MGLQKSNADARQIATYDVSIKEQKHNFRAKPHKYSFINIHNKWTKWLVLRCKLSTQDERERTEAEAQ